MAAKRATDETWGPATDRSPSRGTRVRKTYKLYVNGAFVRSESGTTFPAIAPEGIVELPAASRKDARDAVSAARAAASGWAGRTGYNRGQIIYRMAEMLEARRGRFAELLDANAIDAPDARKQIDAAIDRLVWWAGIPDKLDQIVGSVNPVAGPFSNSTRATPVGVIGAVIDGAPELLVPVEMIGAALASGSTVIVVLDAELGAVGLELGEVLATSDVPSGVVNLLTGQRDEVAATLATHQNVDALALYAEDPNGDELDVARLETLAADMLKRVSYLDDPFADPDEARISAFVEPQTIWHPVGR